MCYDDARLFEKQMEKLANARKTPFRSQQFFYSFTKKEFDILKIIIHDYCVHKIFSNLQLYIYWT